MATKKKTKTKPKPKTKPAAKKPAKKVTKPAKKKVAKPAKKKVALKKPQKKTVKKVAPKTKKKVVKAKPAAKKKTVVKSKKAKPTAKKKISRPIKKTAKKVTKKVAKKPVAKKIVKKVAKPVAKKQVNKIKPVKKVETKKTKPVAKTAPVKPVKSVTLKSSLPTKAEKSAKSEAMVKEKVKAGRRKSKKKGGDEDEPRIDELDPLVEELISVKKKGKQPKVPKVPSPIKLMPTVKIEAAVKEHVIPKNFRSGGKERFEMEFFIKSSPRILYNFISSPSGLSEWFSDDVNIKNGIYTFYWEDSMEQAKLLATREFELMRFKWLNKEDDDTYFEMRIKIDELTGDVALIVTDFAKKEELNESQRLWEAQIHDLCKALGS